MTDNQLRAVRLILARAAAGPGSRVAAFRLLRGHGWGIQAARATLNSLCRPQTNVSRGLRPPLLKRHTGGVWEVLPAAFDYQEPAGMRPAA